MLRLLPLHLWGLAQKTLHSARQRLVDYRLRDHQIQGQKHQKTSGELNQKQTGRLGGEKDEGFVSKVHGLGVREREQSSAAAVHGATLGRLGH